MNRTYKISDVVDSQFLRFPLTLLANPRYRDMSLEAKFVYTLLLNRLTLSQKNGWVNEDNEVYLIYTREDAANTINISYKKAIAAFKELIEHGLLIEQRQGRGYPNLLYVLKAELSNEEASSFAQSFDEQVSVNETETDENTGFTPANFRYAEMTGQDMSKPHIKTCRNGSSKTVKTAGLDMPKSHPTKINNIQSDNSDIENSPSVNPMPTVPLTDGLIDEDTKTLNTIYERCELAWLQPAARIMIQQAIERLYYSSSLKIGDAVLPGEKVRNYLSLLDLDAVCRALTKLQENERQVKNPMAYLMSTLINTICETDSEWIINLPPELVPVKDLYVPLE